MFTLNRILICLGYLVFLSSTATAFFLSWGSPEQKPQFPNYYNFQRRMQAPSGLYGIPQTEAPIPVAAIPVQTPMQAHLAPAANIHNVQLVPCLCPVSQDIEYENVAQESIFINPQNNNQKKN